MLSRCYKAFYVSLIDSQSSWSDFVVQDASGERKYLITASNLTELTLTINKSSKNVLLKYSFNLFYIVL